MDKRRRGICWLGIWLFTTLAACEPGSPSGSSASPDAAEETNGKDASGAVPNGSFLAHVTIRSQTPRYGGTINPNEKLSSFPAFSLSIHESNGQRRIVISDATSASSALLDDGKPSLVKASSKLYLGSAAVCRGLAQTLYTRFELWPSKAGLVVGEVEGEFTIAEGDTGRAYVFKGIVETAPDDEPPEIHLNLPSSSFQLDRPNVANNALTRHPFDGIAITASEALRPPERVFLRSSDGTELDLMVQPGSEATNHSFALPWRPLQSNTTYTVNFVPPATDIAGHPVRNTISFHTSPVPLYAGDDFESDRPRSTDGFVLTPSTKDPSVNLPAISGTTSLVMLPASLNVSRRFAMRLPLTSDSKRITMKVQSVDGTWKQAFPQLNIMVFTEQPKFSWYAWPDDTAPASPRPYGSPPVLGPLINVVLPLPEGATKEVMLSIEAKGPLGCGLIPTLPGLIIDDVAVQ